MDRIEILKAFISRNPADHFSRHALALEYIKRGDDIAAREQFECILSSDPDYIGSYYHLGRLLERQGDISAAVQTYENGIRAANMAGDRHAAGELRTALDNIDDQD